MSRLVVVGDLLLDRDVDGVATRLAPDAPAPVVDERARRARPGGAGLAALLAARDGHEVTLVCALADDAAAGLVRSLLRDDGVDVVDLGRAGATIEKVRICVEGRPVVRLDRGEDGAPGAVSADALHALGEADAVLVADYGRGVAAEPTVRSALESARVPVVWDPHPRGPDPVGGCTVVTPNRSEAARLIPLIEEDDGVGGASSRATALAERWGAVSVAVTLGSRGAVLAGRGGTPVVVPAPVVSGGDPCGAGDRFASALTGELARGELPSRAVVAAVEAASSFVADGGAGAVRVRVEGASCSITPERRDAARSSEPRPRDPVALAREVRARGGTVVATGGCFDLLHAGHVATLRAARSFGDVLVVCLNSDDSVARLKGPDRPLNAQDDRAALLAALDPVDGVLVFDEDTPEAALRELRPHVWVKGGDYAADELPEAAALADWGGRAVCVPFVAGRSTSGLIEKARA